MVIAIAGLFPGRINNSRQTTLRVVDQASLAAIRSNDTYQVSSLVVLEFGSTAICVDYRCRPTQVVVILQRCLITCSISAPNLIAFVVIIEACSCARWISTHYNAPMVIKPSDRFAFHRIDNGQGLQILRVSNAR